MSKLVVFGASGSTGRVLVAQALAAGHDVTAFVRDPVTAPAGARVVVGDVLDKDAVDAAVAGHEVIVSALGHRRRARNPWSRDLSPPDLMTHATEHLVNAARRHGVARLLFVSVHGCGDSRARTSVLYRFLVEKTTIGIAMRDFNAAEKTLAESELDWLAARPVTLSDGAARPAQVRQDRIGSFAMIPRAGVAAFLLAHVGGPISARTPSLA
jgi:putative NADH-flavin reductase